MLLEIPLTQGKVALIDAEDAGRVAYWRWYAVKCGRSWYAARTVRVSPTKCIRIYLHRFLCDCPDDALVDHINRNTLDNRKANLRLGDKSGNAANSRKRRGTYSTYRGVTWSKKDARRFALISVNGRSVNLGSYMTEQEAARAYNAAAVEVFGEFATLNEIPGITHEESITAPVRNRKRGRLPGQHGSRPGSPPRFQTTDGVAC